MASRGKKSAIRGTATEDALGIVAYNVHYVLIEAKQFETDRTIHSVCRHHYTADLDRNALYNNINSYCVRAPVIAGGEQHLTNKCIGDDTKAAARQSLNCIKTKKNKYSENYFQYGGWNSQARHPAMYGMIMTLISPGDCTLQCGMWLWNRDSEFTKCQHLAIDTWLWETGMTYH